MINNISLSLQYWWKSLDITSLEPTNQNSIIEPKILRHRIRQHGFETLDTSIIHSPISPPSLVTG